MSKPDRAEWVIGKTHHNQPLRLVWEKDSSGRGSFTLHRDPANQMDDSGCVRGLAPEALRKMADIAESFGK